MLFAALGLACATEDPGPPARDCRLVVWAKPQHGDGPLHVVGSWDAWAAPGLLLSTADGEPDWRVGARALPPGDYGYLVVEGGAARVDGENPLTTFRDDGLEVSLARIPDCAQPDIHVDAVALVDGSLRVDATFLTASEGSVLAPASATATLSEAEAGAGAPPPALEWTLRSSHDGRLAVETGALPRGRHRLSLSAADAEGREATAQVSVFVDPIAPTWADAVIYQVVLDRFRGDGGAYLAAPDTPASRAGGTLDGVRAAIEDGTFEALGVSALWLSPVYLNPDEARLGTDGQLYTGYHGYWVVESRTVDARLGGEQALRELIDLAHARGMAVILDVIPNHVYETHAVVDQASAAGWFNTHTDECVCGTPDCPWSEYQQTCWFAPYLPDLRLEHPDAMNFSMAEIRWWVDTFDVDGLRIDAVPMMPRAASRRVADLLRSAAAGRPGDDRLLIGEVFTGGGTGGIDGLRYYLGPQGLDSVFDFPLMWAVRETLAQTESRTDPGTDSGPGFLALDALLDEEDQALAGSGAVLGRMLGNHDTPRFVSALIGDQGGDPWAAPASQPEGQGADELAALDGASLGWTLQMTLPGMPVIYYGDELALAGANDPDCRRVLPDPATLSPARLALRTHAQTLGRLRRETPALRSSLRQTLQVTEDTYAYARFEDGPEDGSGGVAVVLISRAGEPRLLPLPGGVVPPGTYRDALDEDFVVELGVGGATLELGPRRSRVLINTTGP